MNRSGKRTVCGIVSVLNADASVVERTLLPNRFYDAEAFVFQQKSAPSRIMRVKRRHKESLSLALIVGDEVIRASV